MGRQWQNLGSVATFLGLFLGISLLPCSVKAENKTYPMVNQNLSPIQGWRSAEYCLRNISNSCPKKYTLGPSGWLNVTQEDGQSFCSDGCAEHTRLVLGCVMHCKRDYWFENGATIKDVNETINHGCNAALGFTGVSFHSSHGYKLNSAPIFTALSASALLLIAFF